MWPGGEPKRLPVAREIKVVEIPSDGEAGDEVEPPVLSHELAVVRRQLSVQKVTNM